MQGSYTYSRTTGNFPGLFSPDNGQVDPNISSQYDLIELLANRDGPLPQDRPHYFKLDGYYTFDLKKAGEITTGVRFRALSGIPIDALGAHYLYGSRRVVPPAARRARPHRLRLGLDLHVGTRASSARTWSSSLLRRVQRLQHARARRGGRRDLHPRRVNPIVGGEYETSSSSSARARRQARPGAPVTRNRELREHHGPRATRRSFGLRRVLETAHWTFDARASLRGAFIVMHVAGCGGRELKRCTAAARREPDESPQVDSRLWDDLSDAADNEPFIRRCARPWAPEAAVARPARPGYERCSRADGGRYRSGRSRRQPGRLHQGAGARSTQAAAGPARDRAPEEEQRRDAAPSASRPSPSATAAGPAREARYRPSAGEPLACRARPDGRRWIDLDGLNPEQRAAVEHGDGPLWSSPAPAPARRASWPRGSRAWSSAGCRPRNPRGHVHQQGGRRDARAAARAARGRAGGDVDRHVPRDLRAAPAAVHGERVGLTPRLHDLRRRRPDAAGRRAAQGDGARRRRSRRARSCRASIGPRTAALDPARLKTGDYADDIVAPASTRATRRSSRARTRSTSTTSCSRCSSCPTTPEVGPRLAARVPPRAGRRVPGHQPGPVPTWSATSSRGDAQPDAWSATTTSRSTAGAAPSRATCSTSSATSPTRAVIKLEQNYRSTAGRSSTPPTGSSRRTATATRSRCGPSASGGEPILLEETRRRARPRPTSSPRAIRGLLRSEGRGARRHRGPLPDPRAVARARGGAARAPDRLPDRRRRVVLPAARDQGRHRVPAAPRQPQKDAIEDPDFDAIRDDPEFSAITGQADATRAGS